MPRSVGWIRLCRGADPLTVARYKSEGGRPASRCLQKARLVVRPLLFYFREKMLRHQSRHQKPTRAFFNAHRNLLNDNWRSVKRACSARKKGFSSKCLFANLRFGAKVSFFWFATTAKKFHRAMLAVLTYFFYFESIATPVLSSVRGFTNESKGKRMFRATA